MADTRRFSTSEPAVRSDDARAAPGRTLPAASAQQCSTISISKAPHARMAGKITWMAFGAERRRGVASARSVQDTARLPVRRNAGLKHREDANMKPRLKKLVRPTITPFAEDAGLAGCARMFVEFDAGAGQELQVSIELKLISPPRTPRARSYMAGAVKPSSAVPSVDHSRDQQPDDPGGGPYLIGLFGNKIPVTQLKTKRRRFGRRR